MKRRPATSQASSDETDRIEWVLATIAAVAVVLLFGYLAFGAVTQADSAPTIELEVSGSRVVLGQTYAEIAVRNLGQDAAADVEIEGRIRGDDSAVSHATLDYAPAESEGMVTLVFDEAISAELLQLRVVGFRSP